MRSLLLATAALVALATIAPNAAAQQHTGAAAFGIEAAGAIAGSALGIGLGLIAASPAACDGDDIACVLERLGAVGLITLATAPAGTYAAGRAFDTRPRLLGAVAGSVVGGLAGLGLLRLLDQAGSQAEGAPAAILFSVTHGVFTALGSRIAAAL